MAVVTWSGLLLAVAGLYWSLRLKNRAETTSRFVSRDASVAGQTDEPEALRPAAHALTGTGPLNRDLVSDTSLGESLTAPDSARTGHRIGAAALAVAGFLLLIFASTIDTGPRSRNQRGVAGTSATAAGNMSSQSMQSRPAKSETSSPTAGSDAVLFWCGTVLTLASAVWLLQAASPFESHASVTIFLIGAAMLFASAQATALLLAMLAAAAVPGWLASRATNDSSPVASAGLSESNPREHHTSPCLTPVREPLLKCVLAASLCWLIAPAIHNSATRESRPPASGNPPADDASQRRMPAPRIQPANRSQPATTSQSTTDIAAPSDNQPTSRIGPASGSTQAANGPDA